MKKWKIGVIGVGGISQMHIQSYLHNPNVELYAFCDINEKRLQEIEMAAGGDGQKLRHTLDQPQENRG